MRFPVEVQNAIRWLEAADTPRPAAWWLEILDKRDQSPTVRRHEKKWPRALNPLPKRRNDR